MSEASKVRLVRCPQCENVLPEPPDVSVYQCGGCGAILRAKMKALLDDGISEISCEEKRRGVSEKGEANVAGLVASDLKAERESNGTEHGKIVERNLDENAEFNGTSSLSTVENRGISANFNKDRSGTERMDRRYDQNRKIGFTDDGYRHPLRGRNDNWVQDSGNCGLNVDRPAYVDSSFDSEVEEFRPAVVESLRSRPVINQRSLDRNGSEVSHGKANGVARHRGFVDLPYPEEGPSTYGRGSYFNYGDHMRYGDHLDGLARVKVLENDRAELLRKLDELADQLTRSCDVAEKTRERTLRDRPSPSDSCGRRDTFSQPGATIPYGINKQPLAPDNNVSRPSYFNPSHGYDPYMARHGSNIQKAYPLRNSTLEYQRFADVYQPQMLSRPSHQLPGQHFNESYYGHLPDHHMEFNQDHFMSHPHETLFHQPACSCMHCFNKNRHVSQKIQPLSRRSQNVGNSYLKLNSYQHVNSFAYGTEGYISEDSTIPVPHFRDRQALTRSSSDLGIEHSGYSHRRLKKVVVAHGDERVFHPIAGGAPFITCCNCCEVLKLPRKLMPVQKNQKKIKCGACSSVLLFELEKKGIIISFPAETEQVCAEVAAITSEMPDERFQNSHDCANTAAINTSDDYEHLNYNSHSADAQANPSSRDQTFNFGDPHMRQDSHSSSSRSSEDELSPDSVILRKEASHSAEFPSKDEMCLPLSDSPSQEYLNHRNVDKVMHRSGQGNKSKRLDQDKINQEGKTSRQNSLKDASVATEIDVSYGDHLNSGLSHDSATVNKFEDLPKNNKGGESFFVGLIKRSFGDFSRSSKSTENRRSNVSVNGHLIPDRLIKKAEKFAGPIQPGEYWYDYQAGFWGVMGHPCLGIIPPNIEEFNYPMPEDCAAGNTGVFVNGRELHQKDLNLLAGRGLPTTRHKSYIVDISGRAVDEHTGEELDGLGKLAPTVQKAKYGFGMKVPKSLLQQQCQV